MPPDFRARAERLTLQYFTIVSDNAEEDLTELIAEELQAVREEALEETALLCEQRARTHELNSKCLDRKSQLVLATHIEECHATARDIRKHHSAAGVRLGPTAT